MDEFVYVLIAGVLIFAIAALISIPALQEKQEEKEEILLFSENIGNFGKISSTFSDFLFGDAAVGFTKGEKNILSLDNAKLAAGFTENSQIIRNFSLNDPGEGRLEFEVENTNLYGNLIVILNGEKLVDQKIPIGEKVDFKLKNLVPGKNTLIIMAQSSGLRFWAPSIYFLKNIKLSAEDKDFHVFVKKFSLKDFELRGFDRAELNFFVEDAIRDDPLSININNKTIFSERVVARALPYTIIFQSQEADLKVGENTIEIQTGNTSAYKIENLLLRVFYFDVADRRLIHREMMVSEQRIKQIEEGKFQGIIEFDANIFLPGTFRIEFEKGKVEIWPKNGKNSIFFDPKILSEGLNEMLFSTDGSMEIKSFKIKLRKKIDAEK
jgi:hypothetical protein